MTNTQKLQLEQSELRQKLNELLAIDADKLTEEQREEMTKLTTRAQELEVELRAAIVAEGEELETRAAGVMLTPEQHERLELRGRVRLGNFFEAALRNRQVSGAEAELQQEAAVDGIPLEVFETREVLERRAREALPAEVRAITPAPGTVGINLDVIRPEVFAPSIADKLQIEMPMVPSGTYATGTITRSVSAGAVDKSEDAPQTAGAITVGTTTPHRVAGSLALTLEDIAAIGQQNFEAVLRENISLVLSDELDNQLINGDGQGNNLTGIFVRLANPDAPAAQIETWERLIAIQAGGIDGLWATMLSHISMLVNPETYRLAASKVRDGNAADQTALEHMNRVGYPGSAVWTNKRMPDKVNHIAQGIMCRKGRPGMRTAVAAHWGSVGIDDIYSGARKGERYFTLSVLVGDVLMVQPNAYAQVAFRVSE